METTVKDAFLVVMGIFIGIATYHIALFGI